MQGISGPHSRAERPLRKENPGDALLAVFVLFVPGHLNGLQLSLVRSGRIVFELRQRGDPFVKIGETDRQGIHVRMFIHQGEGDVFGLFPGKRSHYEQC